MKCSRIVVGCLAFASSLALSASAQCPSWAADNAFPGISGGVYTQCVWDDGTGPALYVGGGFTSVEGIAAYRLAKWNGTTWSAVGGGLDNSVRVLFVWDDGTGSALYLGGDFQSAGGVAASRIAKWDGTSFSPLAGGVTGGFGTAVYSMCAFDEGTGSKLFVGGRFSGAGAASGNIARWDGSQWIETSFLNGNVNALDVFDDGTGVTVYAGGTFGQPAERMARWTGSAWVQVGDPPTLEVHDLQVFDDGSGPRLLGAFGGLYEWDGSAWIPFGAPGEITNVRTIAVLDDGAGGGPALYCGARHGASGTALVRWDGAEWNTLGATNNSGQILALGEFGALSDPLGRVFCGGGFFNTVDGRLATGMARWTGAELVPPGGGLWNACVGLTATTDASGAHLFAAVPSLPAGSSTNNYWVVERDERGWRRLPVEFDHPITSLATWYDEGEPVLVATGNFGYMGGLGVYGIARYQGGVWTGIGYGLTDGWPGYNTTVHAALGHDDGTGGKLFAAGNFVDQQTIGGPFLYRIARFDGSVWLPVGSGMDLPVFALCELGADLVAGGSFSTAGGIPANAVARWNGVEWSAMGTNLSGTVRALAVLPEPGGPTLYAGGSLWVGGVSMNIARFDGTSWSAVGGGVNGTVEVLRVFDDGAGPALFAGGAFTQAGGSPIARFARWDGSAWSEPLGGVDGVVEHLATIDRGDGPELWLGGSFTRAAGLPSASVATWRGCSTVGVAYCFGDGSGSACPCGNAGATGNGCATSFNPAGAHVEAHGLASVTRDTLVLNGSGTSSSVVTYFQGTTRQNGGLGSVFGDGLRCADGSTLRLGSILASAGVSQYPDATSQQVSIRGAIPPGGGVTRTYQVWYRNAASFCTPSTFNLTNGVELAWMP